MLWCILLSEEHIARNTEIAKSNSEAGKVLLSLFFTSLFTISSFA